VTGRESLEVPGNTELTGHNSTTGGGPYTSNRWWILKTSPESQKKKRAFVCMAKPVRTKGERVAS
jgi:hypothetical protein